MTITHLTPMSIEAAKELEALRNEMSQDNPNVNTVFNLISGTKYNVSIR